MPVVSVREVVMERRGGREGRRGRGGEEGGREGGSAICLIQKKKKLSTLCTWNEAIMLIFLPIMLFPNAPYSVRLCSSIFRLCSSMFMTYNTLHNPYNLLLPPTTFLMSAPL